MGYYIPGNLDVDASEVSGGGHNIYSYTSSTGFHIIGEFEHFLSKISISGNKCSWGIGLR